MGCRVVTSCMGNEEHVNELTCSGPTKAGIISAPQKKTKHEFILLRRGHSRRLGRKGWTASSRLSPGLDYFRFVVKYSVKLAGNAASAQCLNVSPPPLRVNDFITISDVSSFQTFTFVLLCSYVASKWWNSLWDDHYEPLVSCFLVYNGQKSGTWGGVGFFVILSPHKSNSFLSIKEGTHSRVLWTVEKPSRAFKTYFTYKVCANLRFP